MAEGLPPRSNVHPMRVLFMISREPSPMLEDKERWSLIFHDFVAKCLTKEPRLRPTASSMLSHKFIEKCKGTASHMLPQIDKARNIRAEMAAQAANYTQEQGTASSGGQYSSWEKGQTVKMHDTSAGTMLVRDTVVKAFSTTASYAEPSGTMRSLSTGELKNSDGVESERAMFDGTVSMTASIRGTPDGSLFSEPLYNESAIDSKAPEADPSRSQTPESSQVFIGGTTKQFKGMTINPLDPPTPTLSHTSLLSPKPTQPMDIHSTVLRRSPGMEVTLGPGTPLGVGANRPGFGIQDKLLSVYAAGNTVPIPFLRATDLSPIALIFDNNFGDGQPDGATVALEAIQELYVGEGQVRRGKKVPNSEMPLPPSVSQRVATSTTLPNLARSLAYHKRCYEEMPSQGWQAAQEQQIINNLSDTLRTILRL